MSVHLMFYEVLFPGIFSSDLVKISKKKKGG